MPFPYVVPRHVLETGSIQYHHNYRRFLRKYGYSHAGEGITWLHCYIEQMYVELKDK